MKLKLQPPRANERQAVLQAWFEEAKALHVRDKLPEAEVYYEAILKTQPGLLEVKHLLGLLRHQQGRHTDALKLIRQVLTANPRLAAAHVNLANALAALGRWPEALASYNSAVVLKPDYVEALNNRGIALAALDRFEEALESYNASLALQPDYADAVYNRGLALVKLQRPEEALASFDRALALLPDHPKMLAERGGVLMRLKRFEAALATFDRLVALSPDNRNAHLDRGILLGDLDRHLEALASYRRVIAIDPACAEAFNNLGVSLNELNRYTEALDHFETALVLQPEYPEAHFGRGIALRELQRPDDALVSFNRAIALKDDYGTAKYDRSLLLLQQGHYETGWRDYAYRTGQPQYSRATPLTMYPQWTGEDLTGKHILVHEEQGHGDIIQFARYLPLLVDRGAHVTFLVRARLHRLLGSLPAKVRLIDGAPEGDYDFQSDLLSLPVAFGTTLSTIPAAVPYLHAEPDLAAIWRQELGEEGFKVGIVWQGNPAGKIDVGRSFPLACLEPIAGIPGVRLIALQKNHGLEQLAALPASMRVETLEETFDAGPDAFIDTAAVMANLDLIITSDTSIAHLAGSLGRPTWLALKQVPDWRWLLNRADSPWYPTLRLYRQRTRGDWSDVFAAMAADLRSRQGTDP